MITYIASSASFTTSAPAMSGPIQVVERHDVGVVLLDRRSSVVDGVVAGLEQSHRVDLALAVQAIGVEQVEQEPCFGGGLPRSRRQVLCAIASGGSRRRCGHLRARSICCSVASPYMPSSRALVSATCATQIAPDLDDLDLVGPPGGGGASARGQTVRAADHGAGRAEGDGDDRQDPASSVAMFDLDHDVCNFLSRWPPRVTATGDAPSAATLTGLRREPPAGAGASSLPGAFRRHVPRCR
ncbi:MAG: hypothetical protein R2713_17870 [Ilumatobacteraceae bacterium]